MTGARVRLLACEGHMSLVAHRMDAIVTDLASAAARAN